MKQIYLAAAWSRRTEARQFAEELETLDLYVKADWLYEDRHAREMAYMCIRDIRDCDVFVRLADDLSSRATVPSHLATGGRMFEQGLAYGLGKEIYVVGGRQMVFDHMPRVVHVNNTEELKRELCPSETIQ